MKQEKNRTSQNRTMKRSTKTASKPAKTKKAVTPTEKQLYARYHPVAPTGTSEFIKGVKPFQNEVENFVCFASFNPKSNTSCNTCKASSFCKKAEQGQNLFGFVNNSGMKQKAKRTVSQSTDNFKRFCVATLLKNPDLKVKDLLKRVHAKNPEKSLSSIKSKLSSYSCCLKALSGKVEDVEKRNQSAVHALAYVLNSKRITDKTGQIKKASELCSKPSSTVSANYSYMITAFTVYEEFKASLK